MARYRFLAHYNREGKLPDQRYTEAGGTGFCQENVYLDDRHDKGFEPPDELVIDAEMVLGSATVAVGTAA